MKQVIAFRPELPLNIKAPFEVPDQNFMAVELTHGALSNVSGTVIYPDAFE